MPIALQSVYLLMNSFTHSVINYKPHTKTCAQSNARTSSRLALQEIRRRIEERLAVSQTPSAKQKGANQDDESNLALDKELLDLAMNTMSVQQVTMKCRGCWTARVKNQKFEIFEEKTRQTVINASKKQQVTSSNGPNGEKRIRRQRTVYEFKYPSTTGAQYKKLNTSPIRDNYRIIPAKSEGTNVKYVYARHGSKRWILKTNMRLHIAKFGKDMKTFYKAKASGMFEQLRQKILQAQTHEEYEQAHGRYQKAKNKKRKVAKPVIASVDEIREELNKAYESYKKAMEEQEEAEKQLQEQIRIAEEQERAEAEAAKAATSCQTNSEIRFGGDSDCWRKLGRLSDYPEHEGEDIKTLSQVIEWLADKVNSAGHRTWDDEDLKHRFVKLSHVKDDDYHVEEVSCSQNPMNEPDAYEVAVKRFGSNPARLEKNINNLRKNFGWYAAHDPRPEGWYSLWELKYEQAIQPKMKGGNEDEIIETDEPIKVGGTQDCWKSIIGFRIPGDDPAKTMPEFIEMVDMMILAEYDFDFDNLDKICHERMALVVQDFGTHLHLLAGSLFARQPYARMGPWYERWSDEYLKSDDFKTTALWVCSGVKEYDESVPAKSMSYKQFKDQYANRKHGVRPNKKEVEPIDIDPETLQIEAGGNCWDAIPLFFYNMRRMEYEVDLGEGKVPVGDAPILARDLIKALRFYTSGQWEEKYGDIGDHFESDPDDKYAISTKGKVWHLYRAGYNNYTDLVEYDEDGQEIKMEEDDGTHTIEGLETFTLAELAEGIERAMKPKIDGGPESQSNPIRIGAKAGDMRLNSVAMTLNIGEVPDTNTWKSLVDSHDLRAAALALAKIDHNVYKIPGVLNHTELERLVDPTKGGWCLGMNIKSDNSLGPAFASTAMPEVAGLHMARQFFKGTGCNVYNAPEWMDCNNHINVTSKSRNALTFFTRTSLDNANITKLARAHSNIVMVVPNINDEMPGHFANESGTFEVRRQNGNAIVVRTDMSEAISHNNSLLSAINTCEYIVAGRQMFQMVTLGTTEHDRVILMSKVNITVESMENVFKFDYNSSVREFDILMPIMDSLTYNIVPVFKMKKVLIDGDLLRTICAHNLQRGDLHFRTLLTRCVGYAHRRYHLKHTIKAATHLTNEQLMEHAYLSAVMVRRMYITRRWLIDLCDRPTWVEQAVKHGLGLGQLALQAMKENSGTFRNFQEWSDRISETSRTNLHDFTNQNVFNEVEAWMFNGKSKEASVHAVGNDKIKKLCEHHKNDCSHTGKDLCTCCGAATEGTACSCCEHARCEDSHKCGHKCDGTHTGDETCSCCGKASETSELCKFCDHQNLEPEYEYEEGVFAAKVKSAGGSTTDTTPKVGVKREGRAVYIGGKKRSTTLPVSPALDLGGGKHCHECAKCGGFYIHEHEFKHAMHPLFDGDCPHCEGNKDSIASDKSGNILTEQSTEKVIKETPPKDDADDKEQPEPKAESSVNIIALLNHGYSLTEVGAIQGLPRPWAELVDWRQPGALKMPMIPMGNQRINAKVEDYETITDLPQSETCGYEVLHTIDPKIKLSVCTTITEKEANYDDKDIQMIAGHYKLNLVVLADDEVLIIKNSDQTWFDVILANQPGHWQLGSARITWNEVPLLTKTENTRLGVVKSELEKAKKHGKGDKESRLMAELSLVDDQYTASEKRLFRVDGKYFTNNKQLKHQPSLGFIAVLHNGLLPAKAVSLIQAENLDTYRDILRTEWKHKEKTDVKNDLEMMMLNYAMGISAAHNMGKGLQNQELNGRVTIPNHSSSEIVTIDLPVEIKWMAGDIIKLVSANHEDVHTIIPTRIGMRHVAKIKVPKTGGNYKLYYPKGGYFNNGMGISTLLQIANKINTEPMGPIESKCLIGVPGAGKSTRILGAAKAGDLIVTATTGNKTGMRTAISEKDARDRPRLLGPQQMIEAAAAGEKFNNVFIDECTMFGALEYRCIELMTSGQENIHLYGDDSQIGKVNITPFKEIGKPTELHRFVRPENLDHEDKSYRLGIEAAEVASKVTGRKITSINKNHTTIKTYNFSDGAVAVETILKDVPDIDVILTFTSNTQRNIGKRDFKIMCEKVHGFQGREANKVIVLQEKPNPGQDVSTNPRYTYSAFTRAKQEIHWVSLGFATNVDIVGRLGKRGKVEGFIGDIRMNGIKEFIKAKRTKKSVALTPEDIVRSRVLESIDTNTSSVMDQATRDKLSEFAQRNYNAIMTYDDLDDKRVKISVARYGMVAVELTWDGKEIKVLKDKFNAIDSAKLKQLATAIKKKDKEVTWEAVGQLSEEQYMIMKLMEAVQVDCQRLGLTQNMYVNDEVYEITHTEMEVGLTFEITCITTPEKCTLAITDEDGVYLSTWNEDNTLNLIKDICDKYKHTLEKQDSIEHLYNALTIKNLIKSSKQMINQAATLIGVNTINTHDINASKYKKSARKANVMTRMKYDVKNLVKYPATRAMFVVTRKMDGELGWMDKKGEFLNYSQVELASARVSNTVVENLRKTWYYKLMKYKGKIVEAIKVGAMNVTLKDMAEHFAEETNTATYIANRMGKIKAKMLKDEVKAITVVPNCAEEWTDLMSITMPEVGVHRTSLPSMIDGNLHMAAQIACRLLPQWKDKISLYTTLPELALESGMYNWKTVKPINTRGGAEYMRNMLRMDRILHDISTSNVENVTNNEAQDKLRALVEMANAHLAGQQEQWITNWHNKIDDQLVVMYDALNPKSSEVYMDELTKISSNRPVWLVLPTMAYDGQMGNTIEKVGGDMMKVVNNEYKLVTALPEMLLEGLKYGCMEYKNTQWSIDTLATNMAITIWKLIPTLRTTLYSPMPYVLPTSMVEIRLPVLSDNLVDMIIKAKTKERRTLLVDRRLYRSLSLRMMREGTTFEDLLVAARTMLHGVIYSPGGTAWKNKASSGVLLDTCTAVYLVMTKKIRNMEQAFRTMADTLSTSLIDRTKGALTSMGKGLLGNVQRVLGMTLTETQLVDLLKTSDSKELRNVAEYLDGWTIRIDEYRRVVRMGTEEWRSSPKDDVPKITEFAINNFLHWKSLTKDVPKVEVKLQHPIVVGKTVNAIMKFRDAVQSHVTWLRNYNLYPKMVELCSKMDNNEPLPSFLDNTRKMTIMREAIDREDYATIKRLMTTQAAHKPAHKLNATKIANTLHKYLTVRNSEHVNTADSMTVNQAIATLDKNEWVIADDVTADIISKCLDPINMDNEDWDELFDDLDAMFQENGSNLQRTRTVGRNINNCTVVVFAIGSRGDMRPAQNLAMQMAADGANVYMVAPNNQVREKGLVNYVFGDYDVDKELDKWHKITNYDKESFEIVMKDQLDNNWLRNVDYNNELPEKVDLVIGSAVSPQGLMYASAKRADYVDFCPMPLKNITHGGLKGIYEKLLSREYILLHSNAIKKDYKLITGNDTKVDRMIRRARPYIQATDPELIDAEEGAITNVAGGYWGCTRRDEAKDKLIIPPHISTVITMGSMRDKSVAERLAVIADADSTMVIGSPNSPMSIEARARGIPVEHGDFDLSKLPARLTVVHHGGAGTTADVSRAGCWQVIIPVSFDQDTWGNAIQRLGLGTTRKWNEVVTADLKYEMPKQIKLAQNPIKYIPELLKAFSAASGYAYQWQIKNNIFAATSSETWDDMLFGSRIVTDYGIYQAITDKTPAVVYDPIENYGHESNTCAIRAINHIAGDRDDELRINLSRVGISWADMETEGVGQEQFYDLCLMNKINPVVYNEGVITKVVASSTFKEVWFWWQPAQHVVIVERMAAEFTEKTFTKRPVDLFDMPTVTCDEKGIEKACLWPAGLGRAWHPDLHADQPTTLAAIECVLNGEPSDQTDDNKRLVWYTKEMSKVVRDRIASGMARERRKNNQWMFVTGFNKEGNRMKIHKNIKPGRLLCVQNVNGSYTMAVTLYNDEAGNTMAMLAKSDSEPTGIIADPSTNLIQAEERSAGAGWADIKSLNKESNILCGKDYPIVSDRNSKQSDKLHVGYEDGYPHHWSGKVYELYGPENIIVAGQVDEDFNRLLIENKENVLKVGVHGNDKLVVLHVNETADVRAAIAYYLDAGDTFGISWPWDESSLDMEKIKDTVNANYNPNTRRWSMPKWANKWLMVEGSIEETIRTATGLQEYVATSDSNVAYKKIKLTPVAKNTDLFENGMFFEVTGEEIGQHYTITDIRDCTTRDTIFVRVAQPDMVEMAEKYQKYVVYMSDAEFGCYTTDCTELEIYATFSENKGNCIFVDNSAEARRWADQNYWPAGGVGDYRAGPTTTENPTGWIAAKEEELVYYRGQLAEWTTKINNDSMIAAIQTNITLGVTDIADMKMALGMNDDDCTSIRKAMKTSAFIIKFNEKPYDGEGLYEITGNTIRTWRCDLVKAEENYTDADDESAIIEGGLFEPGYSSEGITYRTDEINSRRNGKYKTMHNLNIDDADWLKGMATSNAHVAGLEKLADRIVMYSNNAKHIIVTANADWTPESDRGTAIEGAHYVNLTLKSRPQVGWNNYVVPAVNKYSTSLRQYRTLLWYATKYNPNVMVTVVGGREDFTKVAKGMRPDMPKSYGVIKHHKTTGGAQLYLNNASGQLGTLNDKVRWFASDLLHFSHLYGSDEVLLARVAANTIRLGQDKDFETHTKWASYPLSNQPTMLTKLPNWWSKHEDQTVRKICDVYQLPKDDDGLALATQIARCSVEEKPSGVLVDMAKYNVTRQDLTMAVLGKIIKQNIEINLSHEGLWIQGKTGEMSNMLTTGSMTVNIHPHEPGVHTLIYDPKDIMAEKPLLAGWHRIGRNEIVTMTTNEPRPSTEHELMSVAYTMAVMQSMDACLVINNTPLEKITQAASEAQRLTVRLANCINSYNKTQAIFFSGGRQNKSVTIDRGKCNVDHYNLASDMAQHNLLYNNTLYTGWRREDGSTMSNARTLKHNWEYELARTMGSESAHLKPEITPASTSGLMQRMSALTSKKPITTSTIIEEGTLTRTTIGPGYMSDQMRREMDELLSIENTVWGVQEMEESGTQWKKAVAFLKVIQTPKGTRVYLRNRGVMLAPMRAGHMGAGASYDPTKADYEDEDHDEGLWWQTEQTKVGTALGKFKHGGEKHLQMGYIEGGNNEDEKTKKVSFAVAMARQEYLEMIKVTDKPKWLIHHDELTPADFDKTWKDKEPSMVNGALKVYSRDVPEDRVLITYGRNTIDKKKINYIGALMLSEKIDERDENTRFNNMVDTEQNVIIVASPKEAMERLIEIRRIMSEEGLTEARYNTISSTMEEMSYNQINDYNENNTNIDVSGANTNRIYMPLTTVNPNIEEHRVEQHGVRDIVTDEIIAMYEDTDLTDNVRVNAPLNKGEGRGFMSHAMPLEVIEVEKTALTPYPIESRPVLTKMAYGVENAVFNVLGSAIEYRKHHLDPKHEIRKFIHTYGGPDTSENINKWKKEPLYFDNNAMKEWLAGRTGIEGIDRELNDILSQGLFNDPINKLNVHVKLESLLKDTPITAFSQQQVRIIVWQKKGYAAMFSHVFLAAKSRLKAFLAPRFVYADGLTPEQLANRTRLIKCKGFLEDDLTKQDRQTDGETLACEMQIYTDVLGVHQDIVQLWRAAHEHWYFKGSGMKGRLNNMRHTGQATTAIGNVLVNLLVHRRLVDRLGENLKLMMVLGDDNLILTDSFIDAQEVRREIRNFWNMESKAEYFSNYGVFLRMIAVKNESGHVQMGPDFVRLRRRFEFTNGQNEAGPDQIEARVLSYGCMLGTYPGVQEIMNEINPNVQAINWYDVPPQIEGVAEKYFQHLPEEHRAAAVHNEINLLLNNMKKRQPIVYKWNHFTTAEVSKRK
nr:polyprotein [Alphaendornavirus sp.]